MSKDLIDKLNRILVEQLHHTHIAITPVLLQQVIDALEAAVPAPKPVVETPKKAKVSRRKKLFGRK